jgi:hypothetical protein
VPHPIPVSKSPTPSIRGLPRLPPPFYPYESSKQIQPNLQKTKERGYPVPKNTASDQITGQEMAFAHLILSGTMNDRDAAEAVGLNPDTAAYTKAKPRVHAYMIEHRAAVSERLVDQEAGLSRLPRLAVGRAVEGLRKLNLGRDQILTRLWELATLPSEATRGSIAGQIKALSMIVAIEGLIPDRRSSSTGTQPAAPPVNAEIYTPEWLRKQHHEPACEDPGDHIAATKAQPAAPQVPDPEPTPDLALKLENDAPPPPPDQNFDQNFDRNIDPDHDRNQPSLSDPLIPQGLNRVSLTTDSGFLALLDTTSSPRQPFSIKKGPFTRRR